MKKVARPEEKKKKKEKKEKVEEEAVDEEVVEEEEVEEKKKEMEEEKEEEGTLASPGMPADHERCRYDGFTFYSLPTGRFTATAPSTSALPLFFLVEFHLARIKDAASCEASIFVGRGNPRIARWSDSQNIG